MTDKIKATDTSAKQTPFPLFPNYGYPDHVYFSFSISHTEGSWIYSDDGERYLDMFAGIAVNNLGHRHPRVQAAIADQLEKAWHTSNYFLNPAVLQLAEKLLSISCASRAFFCNSGAEANEAAFKLARKYSGKKQILSFQNSFHGRTHATLSATHQKRIQEGFFPLGEDYNLCAELNDMSSLDLVTNDLAAVIIESVQGDGGINPVNLEFMQALAKRCKELGVLLILDEIQAGLGRTGKLFAFQHYGIEPDIISVGKGLGNGIPIGAILAKEFLAATFSPGAHGSTFGSNLLAVRAAIAVLEEMEQPSFLDNVVKKGEFLRSSLQEKLGTNPKVKEIRGMGLMLGVQLHEDISPYLKRLYQEHKVVCIGAGPKTIRLVPALTISEEQLQIGIDALVSVLSS